MAIGKRLRFEVFKRDSFTCQYCGKHAPDVVLQVDHIKPKSKGGADDILNLVAACADCNGGKSNHALTDQQTVQQKHKQLAQLQARKEQLEMMFEWQEGLLDLEDETVTRIADLWSRRVAGYSLNDYGLSEVRKLLKKFGAAEVCTAIEIAAETYLEQVEGKLTHKSVELAWQRVGGICHNRKYQTDHPEQQRIFYIRGILNKRLRYFNPSWCVQLLRRAVELGVSLDTLEEDARAATTWTDWKYSLESLIEKQEVRQ